MVVFIPGNLVAFKMHFVHSKMSLNAHSISSTFHFPDAFIQTFTLLYISYMCVVQYNSAMMKDDICDKRTDHKLSNNSRTCLLAAPLVTLRTLPLPSCPCNPPNPAHRLDTLGQSLFWWEQKWVTCGQRHSKIMLVTIKQPLTSLPATPFELEVTASASVCSDTHQQKNF